MVAVAILAAGLIAAGVFDPRPYGTFLRVDYPGPMTLLEATESVVPQPAPWPGVAMPGRFSVRLTAATLEGESDSGYGLALATPSGRLVVGVSPLGYAAVLAEGAGGDVVNPLAWRPWSHVRAGPAANEIWLDVDNEGGRTHVTAWINRERLWQGEPIGPVTGVELWQASFGEPAMVDFRSLEWYAESAGGNP